MTARFDDRLIQRQTINNHIEKTADGRPQQKEENRPNYCREVQSFNPATSFVCSVKPRGNSRSNNHIGIIGVV